MTQKYQILLRQYLIVSNDGLLVTLLNFRWMLIDKISKYDNNSKY